ncbi:MAG: CinA family nicotinamide mononucleotide deamidase-related protein [Candidatus Delongbacteria bacterium]|nr:CinA family nicotinamide mononucleotide deamidase-related protein [Candidatus Delongbacteria bacterium]
MKSVIINIGDEILIGQVVNTNAAWMGEELNKIGISVDKTIVIRDREDDIHQAVDEALKTASVVIMTGGIGPTNDDITKESLCSYFDTRLVFSEEMYSHVEAFVKKRGREVNENNLMQAYVPENCTVLPNKIGTAAGMKFTQGNSVLYSLPGIPFEMKTIMREQVLPELVSSYQLPPVIHRTIMTFGIPEAFLAEKLKDWENNLPPEIQLAYLPSPRVIRIRLSVYENAGSVIPQLDDAISALHEIIPEAIFSDIEQNLEEVLLNQLRNCKLSISTAESCTGGLIASLITSIPGASENFTGSVVAYNNNIKTQMLDVPQEVLETYGAVSEATVECMVKSVKKHFHTDTAIAVSGIAGPDGGTKEKPVGTTWIAVAVKDKVISRKFMFGSTREVNVQKAAYSGMFMLHNVLRNFNKQ